MFKPYQPKDVVFDQYDPQIPAVFTAVQKILRQHMGEVVVEHIGSTAIPGMPGKNVINVLIPVEQERFGELLDTLDTLGFMEHPYVVEPEDRPLRVAEIEHGRGVYGIHLHLTPHGSKDHRNALYFRDYLRGHPEAQKAYAALKETALKKSVGNPSKYRELKNQFIEQILARMTDEAP